jgi:hypothetical protein
MRVKLNATAVNGVVFVVTRLIGGNPISPIGKPLG